MLKYSWGWNFFDEDVVTLEEARNKLHTVILDLKASCLLLDGDNEDIIEIHDVVRDVAISLAQKNHNMLSVGDGDSVRWPNDDVLRSCTALFFKNCRDISYLPKQLKCPLLEFFYLPGCYLDVSSTVPDSFFEETRDLKVLHIQGVYFSSALPSSFSCLGNLQTLCLGWCSYMEDISIVGELKKLQVLSFFSSGIEELPRSIGLLSELRLLDLNYCWKLKTVPAGLLEGLSNLEELYMKESFDRWEAKLFHSSNSERSNVSLAELKHLPKLRCLEIDIQDAKLLSQDLNFERLERYRIIAGGIEIDKKGIARKLVTTGINHLQNGVKGLLKRTECLCLRELNGIKDVIGELVGDGFPDLKHLSIEANCEIQFILNVELKQQRAFHALESLYLSNLSKLEKICNGRLMQESFCKLTTVKVLNCHKLESLFSSSMVIGLPCLQELQVSDCNILKGIVAKKRDGEDYNDAISEKIEFAQLHKLSLEHVPQLLSFYFSVKEKQSSEIITEEEEPSSSTSFFKEVSFPSLEELTLSEISNLTEIWNHPSISGFKSLKKLCVENCENLKYLFTLSVTMGLPQLQELRIKSCALMKQIVVKEDREIIDAVIFPQLSHLFLENLPNLTTFYSGDEELGSWPLLNVLEVTDCDQISILDLLHLSEKQVSNQVHKLLSNLERLTIRGKDMKMMNRQYGHFPSELFLNLKWLTMTEFHGDESTVFPSNFIYGLHKLETLWIRNSSFEEIFPYEGEGEGEGEEPSLLLPHLKGLTLSDLPDLKYICTENSPLIPMLDKLEDIYVENCGGLIYLIQPSTVRHLEQIICLTIRRCQMIAEIVTADDSLSQEDDHEIIIIFSTLWSLDLEDLPRLTNFCTANNYTFKFPSLYQVNARECPNMRTFSPGITITPKLNRVSFRGAQHWKGDLNTTIQYFFSEMEAQRLITTDPSTSSNNHFEPEAQIHEKPTESTGKEAEEIREGGVGEVGKKGEISVNVIKPENEIEVVEPRNGTGICEEVVEGGKVAHSCGKGKGIELEICEEKVLESAGNEGQTLYMPFNQQGESSPSDPSSRSLANESEEQTNNAEPFAPQDAVASSSRLSPTSDHLETSPSLVASASNSQQKDVEGLCVTKHFIPLLSKVLQILQTQPLNSTSAEQVQFMECLNTTIQLLSSEMEVQRLAITGPSTSSNNHFEPEAKQTESAGQEICAEFSEPRKEGQICKKLGKKTEISMKATKTVMKRRLVRKKLKFPIAAKPSKESEVYENVIVPRDGVDICEKGKGKGKGKEIEVCEKVETWNHPSLKSNVSDKIHSDSSSHSLTNEPEEQNVVASSSQLSPAINSPETSPSLAREANSQENDLQGFRVTKDFITLFGKVLQILQTQPQKDISAEQVQFMEDASRDLSSMNFPTEWLLPYLEKARKCLLVVERTEVISKLELEIAEIEVQLQAKKENKKALEEENVAVASVMDLDKPLYDD